MQTTRVTHPQALLDFGQASVDITPPVGIYQRLFGAAAHDRSSGVHRPLRGDVLVFRESGAAQPGLIRVQLDSAGMVNTQHDSLRQQVADAVSLPVERVVLTYSHTHSGGWFAPDRMPLPGGELIEPYLAELERRMVDAAQRAIADCSPAVLDFAEGRCSMAANRDAWDDAAQKHVCGNNPGVPADDRVTSIRISSPAGELRGSIVHYACHPTTLGWENSLLSPDFAGALRETVERNTARPCVYLQGICGDLGPWEGFVGDTAVADRNGRQVGFAALSALESLGPPGTDYVYAGPVVSGATLGVWKHIPTDSAARPQRRRLAGGMFHVNLPRKPLPTPAEFREQLEQHERDAAAAKARGDEIRARDCRALAERARRWIGRLADFPPGDTFPLICSVFRVGESIWVTTGGEPYNWLQQDLRRRFPGTPILASPLAGELHVAYLLPRSEYGKGLYQEEPSLGAPGCLEVLCDALAERIARA